jgi:hypothetical protein
VPPGESTAAERERELARLRALAEAAEAWARWRRTDSASSPSPQEEELLAALDQLSEAGRRTGRELLVLCSGCRRTRDDAEWMALETFLSEKSLIEFTHGMCPDCMARLYPRHTSEPD